MMLVIAQFIVDIEENEDTASDSDCKSGDVDERESLVPP